MVINHHGYSWLPPWCFMLISHRVITTTVEPFLLVIVLYYLPLPYKTIKPPWRFTAYNHDGLYYIIVATIILTINPY